MDLLASLCNIPFPVVCVFMVCLEAFVERLLQRSKVKLIAYEVIMKSNVQYEDIIIVVSSQYQDNIITAFHYHRLPIYIIDVHPPNPPSKRSKTPHHLTYTSSQQSPPHAPHTPSY